MLFNFKTPLTIETSTVLDNPEAIKDGEGNIVTLKFKGYPNFNKDFILPMLELIAQKCSFYKLYTIKTTKFITILDVINTRHTQFLFKVLKTLGISLNELRIGFSRENDHLHLYLHPKITALLAKSSEDYAQNLIYYLCCNIFAIVCFNSCYDISQDPNITQIDHTSICIKNPDIFTEIMELYNERLNQMENVVVECETLKDDINMSYVDWTCNALTGPVAPSVTPVFGCEYVYNILETAKGKVLVITNKSFADNEYYIINLEKGLIVTNSTLQPYNIFSNSEWLPVLIYHIASETEFSLKCYRIKSNPNTSKLLGDITDTVKMSCDAQEYATFLERFPFIQENYKVDLYKTLLPNATITTDTDSYNFEEYYKDDPIAQQLYTQVQDYYEDVDLQDLTGIVKGFVKGDVYSMLFEGEAGTGKSTAARVIPSKCKLPYIVINCSVNVEESDIFGSMIPNPYKKSTEDPEFIWKDGPATTAIRNGYTLIIEEIGGARPGVLMKLNSLLDESKQIDLPNGEIVHAHPNFRVIATTNIGYEGTNRLNKALVDRFEICKKFKELSQAAVLDIISKRTGYTDIIKMTKIYEVYFAIKKYSTEQNLGLVVSIRELLNIFKQGKYYKSAKEAVTCMLLNKAFLEEPIHLEFFTTSIFKAFDLSFKI